MSLPPTFGQFTLGPKSGVYNLSDSTFSLTAPTSDSSGSFSYTSDNSAVAIIQSPSSSTTTNLLARYDASVASSYTLSGSNVTQWRDLTGNGYHLTPNGTGPTLTTINTNNAFNFNNGLGLTRSSVPLASSITIFMVIKYSTNITPYGGFMHHGNRDTDWSIERDGYNSKVIFESGNNNNVIVDVTNNTNYILIGRIVGTTRQFWRYSDTQSTVFSSGTPIELTAGTKSLYVGRSDYSGANEGCNSSIGEILYYNASISNADVSANLLYLQRKWFQGLPTLGYSVSLISYGYANITATQGAYGNYVSGSVTSPLTVYGNIASTFSSSTFTVATSKTFGDASFAIVTRPTSNSSGAITYSSSNTAVATIDTSGNFINLVGAGDVSFNATQAQTAQYASSVKNSNTLTVALGTTSLTSFSVAGSKTFGAAPFSITAPTTDSSGVITYSSNATSVATINPSSGIITLVAAGTATFTASQAASSQYESPTPVTSNTLTVALGTTSLTSFSVAGSKTFGAAPFSIDTAPTSDSSGAITYSSNATGVATINPSSGIITLVAAGTATFTASQAESAQYNAPTPVTSNTLTVSKGTTTLAFVTPPTSKSLTDAAFTVVASSASSGAVTYTSSNTEMATVGLTTGLVSLLDTGSVTITAAQAASSQYNAPTNTTFTMTIGAAENLAGIDVTTSLANKNLTGISLVGTRLNNISLANANLRNADLSGAVVTGASFINTDISGATNLPVFSTTQKIQLLRNANNAAISAVQISTPLSGAEINAAITTPIPDISGATFVVKAPAYNVSNEKVVTVTAQDVSNNVSLYIPMNSNETVKVNGVAYTFDGTNILNSNGSVIRFINVLGKPFRLYAGSIVGLNVADQLNNIKISGDGLYDILTSLFTAKT